MSIIQVIIKTVYGRDLIYPLTHQKEVEALTGQKTLTRTHIQALKDLGCNVTLKQEAIPKDHILNLQ